MRTCATPSSRASQSGERRASSRAGPPAWRIWVSASRPRTLPAAVAPVVVGSAMAGHDHRFDPAAAGLCLAFALLVQVGTNFANDYYRLRPRRRHGRPRRARGAPSRRASSGPRRCGARRRPCLPWRSRSALGSSTGAATGCSRSASPASSAASPTRAARGRSATTGSATCSCSSSSGSSPSRSTYFVQAGRITGYAVLAGVPMGLLAANILLVNNYRDAETDAAAHKRTLVVRFGRRFARAQHAASLCIALAVARRLLGGRIRRRGACCRC